MWGNGTWPGWHFLSCSKTGSVTEVFPLPCVACSPNARVRMSTETHFIVLFLVMALHYCVTEPWMTLFVISSALLIDTMVYKTGLQRGSQDVVSVCLGETIDLQEQLLLSQGDRGLSVFPWGLKFRDLIITALLLSKDNFLLELRMST